ncbi:MAG: hypothetical protein JSR70_08525 [Proteobacteria bacterium]|nr:hypothetical protein [Pseudomonadota bacterium]
MEEKLEMKWFPSDHGRSIKLKKVDKWAKMHADFCPYFDTWEEAHAWLVKRATDRMASAVREIPKAHQHLEVVRAMTPPA